MRAACRTLGALVGMCIPVFVGRFRCDAHDGVDGASGAFALAVDSCRDCIFD